MLFNDSVHNFHILFLRQFPKFRNLVANAPHLPILGIGTFAGVDEKLSGLILCHSEAVKILKIIASVFRLWRNEKRLVGSALRNFGLCPNELPNPKPSRFLFATRSVANPRKMGLWRAKRACRGA
ncbi:MAG: hypothetical protein ACOCU8_03325 [Patescibacteria group bacterium]